MILSLFTPNCLSKLKDLFFFSFFPPWSISVSSFKSFSFYIIFFPKYFSVQLNFPQRHAFIGFDFTSADTFRSFSILFWLPEIFCGTFDWLHYNILLSQNIYQRTEYGAVLAGHSLSPSCLHKLGLSVSGNPPLLSICKRFVAPSPKIKHFIVMDIF